MSPEVAARQELFEAARAYAAHELLGTPTPHVGSPRERLKLAAIAYTKSQGYAAGEVATTLRAELHELQTKIQGMRKPGETYEQTCTRLARGEQWGREWCDRIAAALKMENPSGYTWPEVVEAARVTAEAHDSKDRGLRAVQRDAGVALEQRRAADARLVMVECKLAAVQQALASHFGRTDENPVNEVAYLITQLNGARDRLAHVEAQWKRIREIASGE